MRFLVSVFILIVLPFVISIIPTLIFRSIEIIAAEGGYFIHLPITTHSWLCCMFLVAFLFLACNLGRR